MKIFLIAGARPNFMKIAPIVRALSAKSGDQRSEGLSWKIVHTGQHYDYEMSQAFFDDLEIPEPDFFLKAGSGSHAKQTAKIMVAFEKICEDEKPDIVVVVGDVNSTLACSIVAKKLLIEVAHVEAGLRSFDFTMPEEINRMVTDSISDYFFVTEKSAIDNLLREGKPKERIHFVGHVMIDNLFHQVKLLEKENLSQFPTHDLKKDAGDYVFLTLHRPSNVDSRETLLGIAEALNEISAQIPIFFPVHPRTRKMLDTFDIELAQSVKLKAQSKKGNYRINLDKRIFLLEPLGFRESLFLWKDAIMVMTDSGCLQEETTALGVPCITLRDNTERPITVEIGTNILAGNKKADILKCFWKIMKNGKTEAAVPPKWDGKAAERIVDILSARSRTVNLTT
ncbi:MAG: UDP-N-acetylglucosamine 2-epimerase (non-hydrolyzing) [Candidatus Aminicenantes bacterium]|nr:UDP-N-acetylglucosamine 2-epimerase (non-hydrolyzing) [Candidatus Aminicenantes bacterium]